MKRAKVQTGIVFFVCFLALSFSHVAQDRPREGSLNILFLGNSLTYTNNLPELVKEIALMDGVEISYTTIALPNYSLEDHWNAPLARKEIASGKYDFVVAQQGPSAALESRELLKRDARRFAKACTKAGSAWGLYMVWPSSQRSFDLDGVITSYSEAATLTSGLLCPAGLAWKLAWREQPDLPLYGPDGFHPSLMGSILAAMTIYAAVQKKENLDFIAPDRGSWGNVIGRSELELLKRSALMAVKR